MLQSNCISTQSYYQIYIINMDVTELYVFIYRQYVQSFFSMPLFLEKKEKDINVEKIIVLFHHS